MPVKPRALIATIAVAVAISLFSLVAAPLLSLVPDNTAYAQEEEGPSIEIAFDPEGTVTEGSQIGFTLTFSGLSGYDSDSGLQYGVNVVGHQNTDVIKCESGSAFSSMVSIGTISGGTATTTGTIPNTCAGGLLILVASLYTDSESELTSTAKGFTVTSVQQWDISSATTTDGSTLPVPDTPAGLWGEGVNRSYEDGSGSAGVTRFHVVDSNTKKVFVYDLPVYDRTTTDRDERDQLIHVKTYDLASTTNPWGIVFSGRRGTTWVSDDHSGSDDKVFAYRNSNRDERVSNEEFDLDSANTEPRGMHFTGDLYVADDDSDKIFAYERRSGSITRDSGSDYRLHNDNTDIAGIWASGHIMWVADYEDDKLYAYEMHPPPREHLPERDVNGITENPAGIWSDYGLMYVLDSSEKKIYGYSLPERNYSPHVVSGPTEVEYPENSTRSIGSYRAQDPEDRSVDWSVYPSGDDRYFNIDYSGHLSFKSPPNYEDPKDSDRDNVYTLILIATSGKFAQTYFPVKVTVTDVLGEQPMFTETSTTRTVEENTSAGENIGDPVEAVNPDNDPIHIYSMSGADAASFDFSTSTGQIISKAALDYETKSSYSVRVSIRDGENEDQSTSTSTDDWIDVTIEVADLDEGPEVNGPNYVEHPENDLQVAEYTADDPNNRPITWELSGDDDDKFHLSATGTLTFRSPPDHETPGDQDENNDYEVMITARAGTETGSLDVTVYVANVNEAPYFDSGQATRSVAENTASGQNVGASVEASDVDNGDSLTYELGGDDASSFGIESSTGQILTSAALDHETDDESTITVIASDQAGATSSITVLISVTDANDQPEFPASETGQRSVEENKHNANVGVPVAATDQDDDILTYELTGGATSSFTINPSTGQLTTVGALDSDTQATYSVTVSVRDNRDYEGVSDTVEDDSIIVAITVTDVNETPVVTGDTLPDFAENGQGTVATYDDGDPEQGSITWSLSGADAADLDVSGGVLTFNSPPNHEAQDTYNVIVQAFDGNSTGTLAVVVTVTDVNEKPEFPDTEDGKRSVGENTGAGQNIGSPVSATDPDSGDSDSLTYILGGTDADLFAIATSTGQILTKAELDAEDRTTYSVYVDVHDGKDADGNPDTNYDDTINVTITVENVNEPPVVSGDETPEVIENGGLTVGTYSADDPEDLATSTWSLDGDDKNAFEISDSGVLSFLAVPDYEDQDEYSVTVQNSDGLLTGELEVTITIINVDEHGEIELTSEQPQVDSRLTATLEDPDGDLSDIAWTWESYSATTSTWTTVSITTAGSPASNSYTPNVDDEGNTLRITATYTDGHGSGKSVVEQPSNTVRPAPPVNYPPVFASSTVSRSIAENTAAGENIGDPVTADDQNSGDILRYALEGTDAASFDMDSGTGQLKTKTALNHEDDDTYTVTIRASDPSNTSDTITVTINVTDVNEGPDLSGPTSLTIVETTPGSVASYRHNDPEGTSISWDVSGVDADDFTITDGVLSFAATPDEENPSDHNTDNVYYVTIEVTDGEFDDELHVTVVVTGENEIPTFPGATTSRDVSETATPGQNVGAAVSATDPERDILTYTLGGSDASHFDISTSTGQILTKSALNYESTKKSYTVTVSVSDSKDVNGAADSVMDASIDVTINVVDENEAPELTGATSTSATENATGTLEAYRAPDPEGATTTWTVLGDAGDFSISDNGVLSIDNAPDYEGQAVYQVKVRASDGQNISKLDVTVNITNVDEPGVVTLSPSSPEFGIPVNAFLTDPDRVVSSVTWTWARSSDKNTWTSISGATGSAHTPVDADEGNYLQATASYDDGHGPNKTASGVTDDKVPTTNGQPSFSPNIVRSIDENTEPEQPIGKPVAATNDETDDTLVYELSGTDADMFGFSTSTGQLYTKEPLDHETKPSYSVTISVSDGKNVNNGVDTSTDDTITVTVNVNNVNEPPVVTGNETPTFNENATGTVATYTAEDPDVDSSLSWGLSGTDKSAFDIDGGELTFKSPPDFESKSTYGVTVQATDGPNTGTLAVTVTVNNVEEPGTVTLSPRHPTVSVQLTATLTDQDEELADITWTWEISSDGNTWNPVKTGTEGTSTSDSYTATSTDEGKSLRVSASYTDGEDSGKSAQATAENRVAPKPITNTAPDFPPTAPRSVEENTAADEPVGAPVTATDDDTHDADKLTYTLGGTDASSFDIASSTGQILTKGQLDRETKDTYTVTVTATDTSGEDDTITVTITVTDVDEPPEFTSGPDTVSYAETATGPVATYTAVDPEEGQVVWDVSGEDAADFRISGGILNFNAQPDYDDPQDEGKNNEYHVTVVAMVTDSTATATLPVIVTVTPRNEPPQFPNGDTGTRSVTENTAAGQNVGAPVSASDPEKNALHYTLSGRDARSFDIDSSTGQLLAKAELNYESRSSYSVRVSVRDSLNVDGNSDTRTDDTIDITINVIDENEAPVITGATSTNFAENGTRAVASYRGRDPEGSTVYWTLLGTDSAYFAISNGGVLSFDPAPDFEDPMDSDNNNVYHVTVQASDGNNINRLDMTVNVTNVEEAGTVELSSVQPQVNTSLTATLDDPDGVTSAITWSWQRSRAGSRSSWTTISTATSNSYTPAASDVGRYLRVTARYDDNYSNGKSARTDSENTVRTVPTENNPPRFLSQFTTRTVDENTAVGQNVGDPVTATDDPTDNLTYTLGGTDAAMFRIVRSTGQVQTRMPLDYESRTGYSVSVTAADPSNATSSIRVNITVVNIDEPPVAEDDTARATEDGSAVTIDVLANDSDPEGMYLTLSAVTQPANGSAVVAGRNVEYTPDAGYYGSDSFTYTVSDGDLTSVGNVSVLVDADDDLTVQDAVIPIQFVPIDGGGERILLSDYFSDPDEGLPPYQATTSDAAIATVEVSEGYLTITPVGIGVATTTLTVSDTPGISQEFRVVVFRPVVPRTDTETVHRVDPTVETTLTSTTTATTTSSLSVIFQAGARDQFFQAAIDAQSNNCGVEAPIGHQHVCVLVDLFDLGAQSIEESLNLPSTLHVDLDQTLYSAVQTAIASGEFQMWKGHGPTDVSWDQVPQCPDPVGQDECYSLIAGENGAGGRITVFNIAGFSEFAAGLDQPALPPTEPPTTTPPPTGGTGGGGGNGGGGSSGGGGGSSGGGSGSSGGSRSSSSSRTSSSYESKGNQAPRIFGLPSVTYAENGTDPVAEYTAEDPNGDDITWSLLGYDRRKFDISNKGVLSFRSPPDYENPEGREGNTYRVILQADDDGRPSEYDVHNVRVTVTQVNELGELSGDTELSVTEDHTGAISQYLVDDPEKGVITWSLSGPDAPGFEIDDQGNLSPAGALDFETPSSSAETNTHVLTVTATDDGEPEASAQLDVTVTISNVNEAPQVGEIPDVDLSTRHLPWMLDLAEFFTDPDGDSLLYEISGRASTDVAHAAVDSGTLSITPAGEGTTSFYVVAADSGGLRVVGKVAVSVTEPEPAPTPVPAKVTVPVPTSTPAPVAVVETVPPPVAPQPPEPVVAPEPSPTHVPLWLLSERRWRNLAQQPDKVSKLIATFRVEPQSAPMAELLPPPMATPVTPKYVVPMDDIAAGNGPGPMAVALDDSGGLSIWLIMLLVLIALVTAGYSVRMFVIHRL